MGLLSSVPTAATWWAPDALVVHAGGVLDFILIQSSYAAVVQALVTSIPITYGRAFAGYAGMGSEGKVILNLSGHVLHTR